MKPAEIVSHLRQHDPKVLGDVPDKRAEQILRAAFSLIRENVAATTEGNVNVPTLGRFMAREVVRKDAGEDAPKVKRVVFFPAKPLEKNVAPLLVNTSTA
ncbi:MAG TPA: hypothetical protein VLA61_19600 [Ideonella sp.]|uniref:hypothetical protein n=1 Tax=Ideonella sp. TaxID=1929293 RepID=UPI002BE56386|nr:hypothetical protein [Ideonella sp.]HSI50477.1 hypothetical protein [Ideonella sp.]